MEVNGGEGVACMLRCCLFSRDGGSKIRRRQVFSGKWRLLQFHRRRFQLPGRGNFFYSAFAGSGSSEWRLEKLQSFGFEPWVLLDVCLSTVSRCLKARRGSCRLGFVLVTAEEISVVDEALH